MATTDDHDTLARARLRALAEELEETKRAIAATADGTALPWPLQEVFGRIATATEQCERVVEDHATGAAPVTNETLEAVAAALRRVREITIALVRFVEAAAES
jgi:hypothetical protein